MATFVGHPERDEIGKRHFLFRSALLLLRSTCGSIGTAEFRLRNGHYHLDLALFVHGGHCADLRQRTNEMVLLIVWMLVMLLTHSIQVALHAGAKVVVEQRRTHRIDASIHYRRRSHISSARGRAEEVHVEVVVVVVERQLIGIGEHERVLRGIRVNTIGVCVAQTEALQSVQQFLIGLEQIFLQMLFLLQGLLCGQRL